MISEGAIYYAICAELNNRRAGTASKKTRAEVRGSSAKPWRQKGHRPRACRTQKKSVVGRRRSCAFAPKPRDFTTKIPKKMKSKADEVHPYYEGRRMTVLVVVENFSIDSGKNKGTCRDFAGCYRQR